MIESKIVIYRVAGEVFGRVFEKLIAEPRHRQFSMTFVFETVEFQWNIDEVGDAVTLKCRVSCEELSRQVGIESYSNWLAEQFLNSNKVTNSA